ncbi:Ies4p SCDLUD_000968 [Saccharomycodes ludwigii]|uniref:Ies4p n=1 Tax=Saccharomycodes ludwigii TaxID=36035 RepID=UPI001E827343|nr:hypothetical protein SCDLUD_000968 [Saccharomycodes ludwigii]KAH3903342.1 hypothetical protein SCDLUD_000968 [Saccharomycodes ludwigii]
MSEKLDAIANTTTKASVVSNTTNINTNSSNKTSNNKNTTDMKQPKWLYDNQKITIKTFTNYTLKFGGWNH